MLNWPPPGQPRLAGPRVSPLSPLQPQLLNLQPPRQVAEIHRGMVQTSLAHQDMNRTNLEVALKPAGLFLTAVQTADAMPAIDFLTAHTSSAALANSMRSSDHKALWDGTYHTVDRMPGRGRSA